jgi:hypothetical protein
MDTLGPILVNLLTNVHPKIRSSASKALAGLVKGLGIKTCLGILKWISKCVIEATISESKTLKFAYKPFDCSDVGPAEILQEELGSINNLCKDENAELRKAGMILLVDFHRFLSCFWNYPGCEIDFDEYIDLIVPIFRDGILDSNEDARNASVTGMKIVLDTFGRYKPDYIFKQILQGRFHLNYWARYHTIVLISTLIHILGKFYCFSISIFIIL